MFEQTELKHYNKPKTRDIVIIISPIIVILLCHFIAWISFYFLGEWAWIPTILLYWFIISLLTLLTTRRDNFKSWFNKSSFSYQSNILFIVWNSISYQWNIWHWDTYYNKSDNSIGWNLYNVNSWKNDDYGW